MTAVFATPTPNAASNVAAKPRDKYWLKHVEGIRVLKVSGSFYEMGRQHGELLRDAIPNGPVPYYRRYIEKMLGVPALAPLFFALQKRFLGDRIAKAMPDFAKDTIRGMGDGSGLGADALIDGYTMPDSLVWVAARLMQLRDPGPAMAHRLSLGLGCTSAVAWGRATADGKLLHARNFDYHGVDNWPKTHAVIFHEPDRGLRYVTNSAAGVPLGGVTAMNEAGLSLTVHQHMFTDATRLGGTPIGVVGDIIMREARNLDEAEAILDRHTPIGCWTYLVTDGNRREMLCWEENPFRKIGRRLKGEEIFGYSNIYVDPQFGATEVDLYGSYWRHNAARFARANELLAKGRGQHSPSSLAAILGDLGPQDAERPCRIANSIAMLMTVGSVVFRPEDGVLWVGAGEAPTSQRRFVPFDLKTEGFAPEHGFLTDSAELDPARAEAFESYRRAYVAYFDVGDLPQADSYAERARALQPKEALYHHLSGLLKLRRGQPKDAAERFDAAIALGHVHPERVAAFHLWRGRAKDRAADRAGAVADYRTCLGLHADPPVRAAAHKGLARPYSKTNFQIDFTFVDVMSP